MSVLETLLPQPPVTQVNLWATVTSVSPLRVQLDGEPGPLDITPDSLVAGLVVDDRVRVEVTTNANPMRQSRRLVILGRAGGVAQVNPFPIGAVYISTDSTDPATLFGGTWTQLEDRFLLGDGATYNAGDTGGEATHVLSTGELPAHTHGSAGDHSHSSVSANGATAAGAAGPVFGIQPSGGGNAGIIGTLTNTTGAHTHGSVGSGNAHNNMPPYLVVYMWERTA